MADWLITGTDTGVGKTVVAAALVMGMRANGVRAAGFKPVETGFDGTTESDSAILARAGGEFALPTQPLLQLAEALAPTVAAERAGVRITGADIEERVRRLRGEGCTLVVEGAGGVMVPLAIGEHGDFYTVLDLGARLGLEAIVVGRAGLGTLNHVALTVAMLRSRGILVRGIVLNGRSTPPALSESTNPSMLARMLPGLPIIEVPHHSSTDVIAATVHFPEPSHPGWLTPASGAA